MEAWSSRLHPESHLGDDVETMIWQFSPPTRYGTRYHDTLVRAANVHVLLNANLTAFETSQSAGHVNAIRLTTLEGTTFRLVARRFVGLLTDEWLHALPGSAGLKPERVSLARAIRALG